MACNSVLFTIYKRSVDILTTIKTKRDNDKLDLDIQLRYNERMVFKDTCWQNIVITLPNIAKKLNIAKHVIIENKSPVADDNTRHQVGLIKLYSYSNY